MQKRLLFLEIGLFIVQLVSWFLPYAYNITPWDYMTRDFFESWQFIMMVTVAMFSIAFVALDMIVGQKAMLRKVINGILVVTYASVMIIYFRGLFDHTFVSGEMVVAVLFSLILFIYSYLIQKGTSFTRNLILCTMALPILFHFFLYLDEFQKGAWLLTGSFFALVVIAAIRPFVAPKLD